MNSTKKVLVLNEGFSDNLGDQVINESLNWLLKSEGVKHIIFQDFTKKADKPYEIITDHTKSKKNFILKEIIRSLLSRKLRWIISNFTRVFNYSNKEYDMVFIGGGQLILSNGTFSIAMFMWVLLLRFFGTKEIIVFGVGSGVRFTKLDALLYKYTLKKVSKIYVRDEKSRVTILEKFNVESIKIYDVGFVHSKITNATNNETTSYKAIMGITSYLVFQRYNANLLTKEAFFDTWVNLLNLNKIKIEEVALFYTTQEDRDETLLFVDYVKENYKLNIPLLETNTKEILVNIIERSDIVISGRMHALILGVAYQKRVIAYEISDKLKQFNNMIKETFNLKEVQILLESEMHLLVSNE
jgi:polysaccharide pyruvyl transferase WcaK-like protein